VAHDVDPGFPRLLKEVRDAEEPKLGILDQRDENVRPVHAAKRLEIGPEVAVPRARLGVEVLHARRERQAELASTPMRGLRDEVHADRRALRRQPRQPTNRSESRLREKWTLERQAVLSGGLPRDLMGPSTRT
jgi:hypothetical protein